MMALLSRISKFAALAVVVSVVSACSGGQQVTQAKNLSVTKNSFAPVSDPRILVMGDSLMAWNSSTSSSISDSIATNLREPVLDKSISGATVLAALGSGIVGQYEPGNWDWIVMNGGGNDLWLGCGCVLCNNKLNRLISKDGRSGKIVENIARLRSTGAQIVYVGYLRTPGMFSPVDHCRGIGQKLENRIEALAKRTPGFNFLSNKGVVKSNDRSYHAADMIHPSKKGSFVIGQRVARIIRNVEGYRVTSAY